MANDLLDLITSIPATTDRAIAIYPTEDGQWAVRWIGQSAEQAASML